MFVFQCKHSFLNLKTFVRPPRGSVWWKRSAWGWNTNQGIGKCLNAVIYDNESFIVFIQCLHNSMERSDRLILKCQLTCDVIFSITEQQNWNRLRGDYFHHSPWQELLMEEPSVWWSAWLPLRTEQSWTITSSMSFTPEEAVRRLWVTASKGGNHREELMLSSWCFSSWWYITTCNCRTHSKAHSYSYLW